MLEEKRRTFTGTFKRIGYKPGYKGRASSMTVLIVDIRNKKGELMTKHLWFNYTKGFQELNLTAWGIGLNLKLGSKNMRKAQGLLIIS